MKDSPIKILLIEPFSKQDGLLKKLLNDRGYVIESEEKTDVVIDRILSYSVNLVICKNTVNEFSGFEIFKILEKYLRNCGIAFFLVLDSSEREDMFIGLEIGIDNFIFTPYNEISLYCKIENQLKKGEELNIFGTNHFAGFFESSVVAMFFVSDNKVARVNEAFHKMYKGCSTEMINLTVDRIFNIKENKLNELNFRRFQNGITNDCRLTNVSCSSNPYFNFDINFFRGNHLNSNVYFAEILPSIVSEMLEVNNTGNQNNLNGLKGSIYDFNEDVQLHQIKLTERETQIFELSANGMPIKLIANKLNLSERTVEKHRANIMAKSHAKNMIEAIASIKNSHA
jgi:two-component system alkaline phosphatase synthesis response regulator PhoP